MACNKPGSLAVVDIIHRVYKRAISPLFGNACRFYPSCSDYAHEAIVRYGWFRGGWLAVKRLVKCHPRNPGGEDRVP